MVFLVTGKQCNSCWEQNLTLQECGGCKSVSYCGRDCQKKDWPKHKKNCLERRNQEDPLVRLGVTADEVEAVVKGFEKVKIEETDDDTITKLEYRRGEGMVYRGNKSDAFNDMSVKSTIWMLLHKALTRMLTLGLIASAKLDRKQHPLLLELRYCPDEENPAKFFRLVEGRIVDSWDETIRIVEETVTEGAKMLKDTEILVAKHDLDSQGDWDPTLLLVVIRLGEWGLPDSMATVFTNFHPDDAKAAQENKGTDWFNLAREYISSGKVWCNAVADFVDYSLFKQLELGNVPDNHVQKFDSCNVYTAPSGVLPEDMMAEINAAKGKQVVLRLPNCWGWYLDEPQIHKLWYAPSVIFYKGRHARLMDVVLGESEQWIGLYENLLKKIVDHMIINPRLDERENYVLLDTRYVTHPVNDAARFPITSGRVVTSRKQILEIAEQTMKGGRKKFEDMETKLAQKCALQCPGESLRTTVIVIRCRLKEYNLPDCFVLYCQAWKGTSSGLLFPQGLLLALGRYLTEEGIRCDNIPDSQRINPRDYL